MNNDGSTQTTLRRLVDAVGHDHMTALQALSILRLLSASQCCPHTIDHNAFLTAVHATANEALIMALWRMFDPDDKNAGIVGICTYAKKHPHECEWLFSAEGLQRFPDGGAEVQRRADQWLQWREQLPFTDALIKLRHWYVGHRGLKAWLGKAPEISIKWSEIAEALSMTDRLVNDFRQLTDDTTVFHKNIYDQVLNDGSHTLAMCEAHTETCIEDPLKSGRMSKLKQVILAEDKAQIERNQWSL